MELGINNTIKNGGGDTLIYTALLSACLANFVPTPADAIFFWREQVDKDLLEKKEITPKQFWIRNTCGYYGYTAAYYALLFGTVYAIGGSYKTKARIILALLSGGLIVGVIAKNIQKDNKIQNK